MNLKSKIRNIENFPIEGVTFRDITTALKEKEALKYIMDQFIDRYKNKNIDYVVGADARGFIFGAALAYNISAGFIPIRKVGKLPYETEKISYKLEYGKNEMEIHKDAISKGDRVVIIDDLLATGGTAKGMADLINKLGGEIEELAFMIELSDLKGRDTLRKYNVHSLVVY